MGSCEWLFTFYEMNICRSAPSVGEQKDFSVMLSPDWD